MKIIRNIFLLVLFIFIAFSVFFPNPFGNNPDIIADESYFLTSSLSAIEKVTLPGWEFSRSGNYYGGVQTYIDTVALIPVLGIIFMNNGFSVMATKVWVALNTGELLHVLRIVNELIALGTLLGCFFYFKKRRIPRQLALILTLWLFLLLSNALFIQLLHTAKVWTLYTLIVVVVSAFFIANEYYLTHLGDSFLPKKTYVAVLVWSTVLIIFQNYYGAISIGLLIIYAVILHHIKWRDVWEYLKKYWYLIVIFGLTQISFLYRAVFVNGLTAYFGVSATNSHGNIDWYLRLYKPLEYTIGGQPLSLLYLVGIMVIVFLAYRNKSFLSASHKRLYMIIACLHPLIIYFIFHVLIGLSLSPRYGIILTVACCFSAVILLSEINETAVKMALVFSSILFLIVNIHAISLYWQPSSETILLNTITAKYNSADNIFIEEPSALHLTLPINDKSLLLLDEKRAGFERFKFLLNNIEQVRKDVSFRPLTMITYTSEEEEAAISRFKTGTSTIWMISTDNNRMCSAKEIQAGSCFAVYPEGCDISSQEPNLLPAFLNSTRLGNCYIVRKIFP